MSCRFEDKKLLMQNKLFTPQLLTNFAVILVLSSNKIMLYSFWRSLLVSIGVIDPINTKSEEPLCAEAFTQFAFQESVLSRSHINSQREKKLIQCVTWNS